jgi:hypothetical protein
MIQVYKEAFKLVARALKALIKSVIETSDWEY